MNRINNEELPSLIKAKV